MSEPVAEFQVWRCDNCNDRILDRANLAYVHVMKANYGGMRVYKDEELWCDKCREKVRANGRI